MADTKISAATSGGAAQAADQFPINRGGTNYRLSADDMRVYNKIVFAGTGCIGIGAGVLSGNSGNYASGLGVNVLANNSGASNTGIGWSALTTNTTGANNTAGGYSALRYNVAGVGNTALGSMALSANLGDYNTGIGYNAGLSLNGTGGNGTLNVLIGYNSGHDATTAYRIVVVGAQAGYKLTDAYDVTVVGEGALTNATSLHWVTAIGAGAARDLQTGVADTVIGEAAGQSLTTAHDVTIVGTHAGLSSKIDNYSVLVGVDAGHDLDGTALGGDGAAWDVMVGTSAGEQCTTAVGCVILGGQAMKNHTTGDKDIAIGFGAGYYLTGSNQLIIDNDPRASEADEIAKSLIYGKFDPAVVNQEIRFNAGKMGFYGQAAVAKPTGVAVSAAGIHAALVSLGLIAP